ncbi:baseplate J/gp47 family protein [Mycolicibacterium iranicum]|uniref:Uncharacterized protein n=1 Tax=Mycolicibacterium iranicum TaxID=912594 RepID=A0A178LTM7_MYCIR|nr:baseplate J/gp47 family protein [Mycolicibacterium iranicum]OAN36786.1 hypothetical protein A4X20_06215 [Mycolicibacterium iranicum]
MTDCVQLPVFPACPHNRPGLPHINRRLGGYPQILEALHYRLNREPLLAGWTHRSPDDPGIALLEGAAILGDILTFYQELYANEAYLRTAQWRESVSALVRLLGYRLSPGVGGRTTVAIEMRGSAPVTVPMGFPLSAQVTGIEAKAEFQTVTSLTAYPWLSRFSLYRPVLEPPVSASTAELRVASTAPANAAVDIKAGDRLLIGDVDSTDARSLSNVEVVVVDSVRERHGETLYRIKGALQRTAPIAEVAGFKIGRSFRHFGHNAPPTYVSVDSKGAASQISIYYSRVLNDATEATTRRIVAPTIGQREFPIDSRVDDLPLGASVVCQITPPPKPKPTGISFALASQPQTAIRTIRGVRQGSYSWGSVTGPSTVLTLDEELASGDLLIQGVKSGSGWSTIQSSYDIADIRDFQFHETLSPLMHLRAATAPTGQTRGNHLGYVGTDSQARALSARPMMLLWPGRPPVRATVQAVEASTAEPQRRRLRDVTLDMDVDYAAFPLEQPQVVALGNLVDATQGKGERRTELGNGDSRQTFQTFKLPKAPLTYLPVAGETPPETPELRVYVDDLLWKRAASLFTAGPTDRVYIVREDSDGNSWVQFGDGKTGSRLPSGVRNVVAVYRTGIGAFGALVNGTTVAAGGRIDGLDKVNMPDGVTGGAQPESADRAREAAPGKVQSLGRLVSLRDYETETLALAGVTKVSAAWRLVGNVPAVVLTVLMDTGRDAEISQVRSIVAKANRSRGPARHPVVVHPGTRVYFFVAATVALDPTFREDLVLADIRAALGVAGISGSAADGTAHRAFGEREYRTRLEGLIQAVAGVRWVRLTALRRLGPAADPTQLNRPPFPVLRQLLAPGPEQVLALHTAHLSLHVTAAPTEEGQP